jgi:hypothetical protein
MRANSGFLAWQTDSARPELHMISQVKHSLKIASGQDSVLTANDEQVGKKATSLNTQGHQFHQAVSLCFQCSSYVDKCSFPLTHKRVLPFSATLIGKLRSLELNR